MAMYSSRFSHQADTLNWGRVCGIAFAITVQASLFMLLLIPPGLTDTAKDDNEIHAATIIEPPPPPPPPPPQPPKEIPKIIPKEVPPPPTHQPPPPPMAPPPPVVTDAPTPMAYQAPPPAPPAPPAPAQDVAGSVDISFQNANPPDYPAKEMADGVTGVVTLVCQVDANGVPSSCTAEKNTSHNRNLERAAKDAAMKWRVHPTIKNGVKVPDAVRVPVEFKL